MMKSAKEILAQYRIQGFSDELIELLAMEEEDQGLAEALLDELISDQEGNKSIQLPVTEDIIVDETDEVKEDDVMHSEDLIKSAYLRNGMTEDTTDEPEKSSESTYIPPTLEVIEGGAGEEDETIIHFAPEYALSEEEHEYAVTRSLAFFGEIEHEDELSTNYSDENKLEISQDEDWYIDDVEIAEIEDIEDYEFIEEYDEVEVLELDIAAVEVVDEEPEFDCIDFDNIGRSTASTNNIIDIADHIIDLDYSRPAEDGWATKSNDSQDELSELQKWAHQVEEGLVLQQLDKENLEEALNNRDETLVLQGEQMEQLRTLEASYIEQLSNESHLLAKTQAKLNDAREEADRTEQELLTFGNEIELLHGQLYTAHAISSNQSKAVLEKEETIRELSTAYSKLLRENEAGTLSLQNSHSEETRSNKNTISMLGREISELKSQLAQANVARAEQSAEFIAKSNSVDMLSDEIGKVLTERDTALRNYAELEAQTAKQGRRMRRLEKVRTKIKTLEFQNNVFKTETVPNLQADKEDLVELASEEYNKSQMLDEIAAKRSRRLSYTTTLAACACLMLVLMPILSWNNIETEKANIKSDYSMQLAAAETNNLALEEELEGMQGQFQLINQEFTSAKAEWNAQLASLRIQREEATQGAQIIQAATGEHLDESQFNVVAYEDDLMLDEPLNAQVGFDSEAQYNGISGLEEYQQEYAQASSKPTFELLKGKQTKVRAGEGLSQVLWRVYRTSSPEMVSYISNINKLKKDKRGQPMLNINQSLVLPKDVNTAMMNNKDSEPNRM